MVSITKMLTVSPCALMALPTDRDAPEAQPTLALMASAVDSIMDMRTSVMSISMTMAMPSLLTKYGNYI